MTITNWWRAIVAAAGLSTILYSQADGGKCPRSGCPAPARVVVQPQQQQPQQGPVPNQVRLPSFRNIFGNPTGQSSPPPRTPLFHGPQPPGQQSQRPISGGSIFGNVPPSQGAQTSSLRQIKIDRGTSEIVTGQPGDANQATSIVRKNRDGSQTVMDWRNVGGTRRFDAYKRVENKSAGTVTQTYTDGRKLVTGRDFVSYSEPGQPTVTTYSNGLRAESLRNGREIFHDRIVSGPSTPLMQRTIYLHVQHGHAYQLRQPIVENFAIVTYQGETLYEYVPPAEDQSYYDAFNSDLPHPVTLASVSQDCPASNIEFKDGAPDTYEHPADLLTDTTINEGYCDEDSGSTDNVDPPPDAVASGAAPAAVGDAGNEAATVNKDVAKMNSDLSHAKTAAIPQPDAEATDPAPSNDSATHTVPTHIHTQVKKQIKQALNNNKQGTPLTLEAVINSGHVHDYEFRADHAVLAEVVETGGTCVIHTNDYVKIDRVPDPDDASVSVKIDVSGNKGSSSCGEGIIVLVKRRDLQDMLNDFNERLIRDAARLTNKIASNNTATPSAE